MAAPHRRPNRLIHEASPYLQQHAYNPVDWYPWGPEALERARAEDRPILLSIGYAACHWCHVMERECFEDPAIAERMNRGFVNVKVDREERPDLDQVYQTAAQILGSGGGWPLTVFLTPDLKPFFAGTYFPPEDRHGLPGFPKVLEAVLDAYRNRRDEVERVANRVVEILRRSAGGPAGADEPAETVRAGAGDGDGGRAGGDEDPGAARGEGRVADATVAAIPVGTGPSREAARRWLERAASRIARSYDPEYGGFGRAPKFPHATGVAVLLRAGALGPRAPLSSRRGATDPAAAHLTPSAGGPGPAPGPRNPADPSSPSTDPGGAQRYLDMALHTLQAMAMGGLFDHLGGGFHRYATDRAWLVPHFEKMLYDQAQLVPLYLDAHRVTGDPFYAGVARRTLDFVLREMAAPEGAFISTLDADSDGREGAYYVWTPDQLREALGDPDDADLAARWFGVTEEGNFEDGTTVLYRAVADADLPALARELGTDPAELTRRLESIRRRLLEARRRRTPPGRDDKILVGWNGLMIAALAQAAPVLDEPGYAAAARRAAAFVLDTLRRPDGRLLHAYRGRPLDVPGFLQDYAFLMEGLLALHAADGDPRWLDEADRLARPMIDGFWDETAGVFYDAPEEAGTPLVRPVELFDQAVPAGGAAAASALARLAVITGDPAYRRTAEAYLRRTAAMAEEQPLAMASTVLLQADQLEGYTEVTLVGDPAAPVIAEWRRRLAGYYLPGLLLTVRSPGAGTERRAVWEGRDPVDGRPVAYVCRNFTCSPPQTDWEGLRRALGVG
ncbi:MULTISPECIES: thioredoxin domain-containing protein [Thermaerobacter]|uniref:Thioredoxin domain-containing protein n=1 Tax=Thermaerobacter composti TaxID=554949 RepID=A0ABZ0QMF7_9FIRM|nr:MULTISPECIES: thioredoxin domain-containing protein [Thermaerobacter]QBS36724.1 thioredoxin domain-containing protein [Thermaerobacter sp. FW80]WPD18676.1 thioredoxin domain-containing protein [Thermaerobacter composti]